MDWSIRVSVADVGSTAVVVPLVVTALWQKAHSCTLLRLPAWWKPKSSPWQARHFAPSTSTRRVSGLLLPEFWLSSRQKNTSLVMPLISTTQGSNSSPSAASIANATVSEPLYAAPVGSFSGSAAVAV